MLLLLVTLFVLLLAQVRVFHAIPQHSVDQRCRLVHSTISKDYNVRVLMPRSERDIVGYKGSSPD